MSIIRAVVCLATMSFAALGCSSSGDAGDTTDASLDGACTRTDVCCCSGDVVDLPICSVDGAISCNPGYTFYTGSDCITKCSLPRFDSGVPEDTRDATSTDGDAKDTAPADTTPACTGWDADWGDAPKPDVMSPCRGECDCPSGFHCCAAAGGRTCAPAFEC